MVETGIQPLINTGIAHREAGVGQVGAGLVRAPIGPFLAAFDQVWASGGVPHAIFPTSYDELLRLTAGSPADVA